MFLSWDKSIKSGLLFAINISFKKFFHGKKVSDMSLK